MMTLSPEQWEALLPELRSRCPRLTPTDLDECERRSDILIAKIQNRHWISKDDAMRLLWELLQKRGLLPA